MKKLLTNNIEKTEEIHDFDEAICNKKISHHVSKHKFKYFFYFILIGIFTNFTYNLIQSASQKLSQQYNMEQDLSLYNLALILSCAFSRFVNSRLLIKIQHKIRVYLVLSIGVISMIIMIGASFIKKQYGFYISLIGSLMQGFQQGLSEAAILGYMKAFPPQLVGSFTTGTGIAGFSSSLYYLILSSFDVRIYIIFVLIIPLFVVGYWFPFMWINKCQVNLTMKGSQLIKQDGEYESNSFNNFQIQQQAESSPNERNQQYKNLNKDQQELRNRAENYETQINYVLGWNRLNWSVYKKVSYYCINLGLVYFFEYIINSCFSDVVSRINQTNQNFFKKNQFAIMMFMYQFGVFISRSSLPLFKVSKLWIVTSWQFANFVIAYIVAIITYNKQEQIINQFVVFAFFLMAGLMGGCSYVNTAYLILHDKMLIKSERELSCNFSTLHDDAGIFLASLFSLLLSKVQFPKTNQQKFSIIL